VKTAPKNPHDPDAIIAHVLARYLDKQATETEKKGMARATLVVDENVAFLAGPLKEANFHIITPPKGMKDFEIKKIMLAHRIIVTKNTKDFLADAPVLDYGIIGLEALPFVDGAPEYKDNKTAQMISKAVSEQNLAAQRTSFVLMLKPKGKHFYKKLA
jgi:hypothetical protein